MGGEAGRQRSRGPAEHTGDGAGVPRFYRPGPGVTGQPHVLVHKGDRTRLGATGPARIGEEVEFLLGGNHRIDWVSAFALREVYGLPGAYEGGNPWSKGDILVGSDVVIGRGARILSGVTLGDGAVVLPYSVVSRDVAPGQVVAGHPASVVAPAAPAGAEPGRRRPGDPMRPVLGRARAAAARLLRAAAWRVGGEPLPGFPPLRQPPDLPQPLVMGPASYFEPIVRAEGDPDVVVEVGPYASISYDTEFLFPSPDVDPARVAQHPAAPGAGAAPSRRRATVGGDTWITRGTRVVGEVSIGAGAVVGAYSVVFDDVRPYAIVAGNPAVEVGRRFDDGTVEALLRIAWWDWPEDVIKARASQLCSTDVAGFVARYDPAGEAGAR